MKQALKKLFAFVLTAVFIVPFVAFAATSPLPPELTNLVDTLASWGIAIAGSLTILVVVGAGILFIANGGDESKIKTARNMILYAAIGLLITMLAVTIKTVVESLGNSI
jgi:uncharacterized membrane protein YozB (DUF420 family)